MLQATDALPVNIGLTGKGNTSLPRRPRRPDPRRRHRPQAPRGLGHDAERDRLLPDASPRTRTCRSRSTPTRSTSRATSTTRSPRSRAARSTRTTPRAPAAATRPDIIRVVRRGQRPAELDEPDAPVHRQHARRAPRHAHGLPPPRPEHPRGRGVRREPHPRRDDRRRGRPARPRRDQHDLERQPGHGPRRRGHLPHLADRRQDEGRARPPRRARRGDNDNLRIRRYIAKYTINPAIAHGMAHEIGSVEVGKLGRPRAVAPGASSASGPSWCSRAASSRGRRWATRTRRSRRRSPSYMRPMFGALGRRDRRHRARVRLAARRRRGARRGARARRSASTPCAAAAASAKRDMKLNDALPVMTVDPETLRGLRRRRAAARPRRRRASRSRGSTRCSDRR